MPIDLSSVAREAAEREFHSDGLMERLLHPTARMGFEAGFIECASRLPSEEEICSAILGRTATAGAKAVLALIGEKIRADS